MAYKLLSSFCALIGVLYGTTVYSQVETPHAGYIVAENAPVRSGPGRVHYATDYLRHGEEIEIWRHDPGGWLAIRPPSGSFCWLSSKNVKIGDDPAIGRISAEDVKAWVGTTDDTVREFMWQVRLRPDELVAILGKRHGKNKSGEKELWLQIAPPSGEFRWINEKHVSLVKPLGVDRRVTLASANEPVKSSNSDSIDFEAKVKEIDVLLSKTLAQPVDQWNFTKLRRDTTALVGQAQTDLERGQARLIVDKIDRFQKLQRSIVDGNTSDQFIEPVAKDKLKARTSDGTAPIFKKSGRYDASGWLIPVASKRNDVPPYALLDDDGQILQYITPAPGHNLNRYLRKEIGVYGRRGFIRDLNAPHVTAHRIIVLDRHRR